jgi:hypothetical protein
MNHAVQCQCGQLKGYVSRGLTRGVCYCRDCQAYAHTLGKPRDVLDELGGTELVGALTKDVTITQGLDALACLSLTEKGLLRWYAACCDSPIGNTPRDFKVSFIGLFHTSLRNPAHSLEQSFGPVRMRANLKHAKRMPDEPMRVYTLALLLPFAIALLRARWSGTYRTTPFFRADGVPIATPRVLSRLEWQRAMDAI